MPVRKTPAAAAAAPVAAAAVDLAIPPQLLQHLRERRLLLFAGAGLSAQAGLPTWRSLVQDVVDATIAEAMQGEESRRELEGMIAAGKWLQIADHCKLKLGPGEYARLLGEQLGDFGKPVPEAHRLAVRLPFAAWVTTNYDKLLERAYAEERGGLPKTLTSLDTEALGRLLFDGAPFVLKAALPLTHSVLFVGYSLADPDFNLLLDRQLLTFRGFAPERYALMSGIGKVEEEYLWRVCQIRVIPYPEGQHEAVPAFFQRLADRLDPADVAPAARVARAVTVGVAPPALRAAHATRAGPAPVAVATPASLALDWREGAVQAILSDGGKVIATAAGPREAWATPAAASRSLQSASARDVSLAECSGALTRTLGAATVKALARVLKGQGSRLLRLDLTREVERLPWELLALGSQTLAEMAAVFRAPVGVSENARGLPAVGSPLRALVVADTESAQPALALPGAAAEGIAVADEIRGSGVGAFLGTYSGAIDDCGARDFAVAVFRALLHGATVAGALQSARSLAGEHASATALLYCLYGEGALRLVDGGQAA